MPGYFDEHARLAILAEHDTADFESDETLSALTSLAADICDAPICLVSLVETARQHLIARTGLDATETPRDVSFCQHAMVLDEVMVVPDAQADPRFADNGLVLGEPSIRFYAGAPLHSKEGAPMGALCVIDRKPRAGLTPLQTRTLKVLAEQVMAVLDARRRSRLKAASDLAFEEALIERENRFHVLADTMPQMVWSTRPDGYHDYYNARWYEFTGVPPGSTDGEGWNGMFHPDDQERAWARWRRSLETGEPYEIEYRLRNAAGAYRWTLGRALPMRNEAGDIVRWFGTCTEIHEQKLLLEQRQIISQELSHRIKNIFSIIAGMINLMARRHPEIKAIAADLHSRVIALGRAHDFVRPHSEISAPKAWINTAQGMLRQIFAPYDLDDRPRIVMSGDDPAIDDRVATPLALMFHELATNAAKYGSLSRDGGVVELTFADRGDHVRIDWRESGGPALDGPPHRTGFGSELIELGALRQMDAKLARDWAPEGLRLSLEVPAASFASRA